MFYRILLVAASLLALPGQAQGVYKVVGADGRITYTDRPPPPAADAVVKPFGRQPATPPERAAPATAAAPAAANMPVAGAAARVHIAQRLVASAGQFCHALSAPPASTSNAKNVSATASLAVAGWETRHAELVLQKDAVLRDQFTQADLRHLAEVTQRENTRVLAVVTGVPAPAQLEWCRQLGATLVGEELDLRANRQVVEALMHYRPRKLARPGPVVQG